MMASIPDIKDFLDWAEMQGVVLFVVNEGEEASDDYVDELLDEWDRSGDESGR
jgi:hypothetical protein